MSAQSVVSNLLREQGPLTIDELLQHAAEHGGIASRNPKQTVRNALANARGIEPGVDGRYVYFPRFIEGARVRIPLENAAPEAEQLAISVEASALLWPEYASGSRSRPRLMLENGPIVEAESAYRWSGNLQTIIRLPAAFWDWLACEEGPDTLILSVLGGEASSFSMRAVRAETLDAEEVAARNTQVREVAASIQHRARSLMPGDLARRLLAHGVYHQEIPPEPLKQVLLTPGGPFVREQATISYRPDITPPLWRLFRTRLAEAAVWEESVVRQSLTIRPGDDEALDEDEMIEPERLPLPENAELQGYRLRVRLKWLPKVWRDLAVRGDQSLQELHLAIQDAFNWDNDHLYAFYLSGKAHDTLTEVGMPVYFDEAEAPFANEVVLAHLEPVRGQRFLYLFDFGDNLQHEIEVAGTFTPAEGESYPRIVESHGEAPLQYPVWDE